MPNLKRYYGSVMMNKFIFNCGYFISYDWKVLDLSSLVNISPYFILHMLFLSDIFFMSFGKISIWKNDTNYDKLWKFWTLEHSYLFKLNCICLKTFRVFKKNIYQISYIFLTNMYSHTLHVVNLGLVFIFT